MVTAIEHKFKMGESVKVIHDPERLQRMITCIRFYRAGDIVYELACGTGMTNCFEYEIEEISEYELSLPGV